MTDTGLERMPTEILEDAKDQLMRSEKKRRGKWSYRLDDSARLAVVYAVRYVMEEHQRPEDAL